MKNKTITHKYFIFTRAMCDTISKLKEKEQTQLIKAIVEYGICGQATQLNYKLNTIFDKIKKDMKVG